MKHPERAEDYLEHIAQAIERAMHYVQPLDSVQALEQSPLIQDALIRNLEIIGEAASQIQQHAPEFFTAHPELPWIEMRGIRNKMIHGYFDVSLDIVWNTVKTDLPLLQQQIQSLLLEHRQEQDQEQDQGLER